MALAEADYGLTEQAHQGMENRFVGDENLYVRFFVHPKLNQLKSTEEGRPIFSDTEYVQIMQPGNKDSIVMRPVREMDKQRFPKQYAAFQNQDAQLVEGTPLSEWPGVTRSQVEELKFFNIHTVEQLVNMSDSNSQQFMGASLLKRKAEAFLATAEDNKHAEHLAGELKSRDDQIQQLQETVAALSARLDEQEDEEVEED